jgi:hypothetical protein
MRIWFTDDQGREAELPDMAGIAMCLKPLRGNPITLVISTDEFRVCVTATTAGGEQLASFIVGEPSFFYTSCEAPNAEQ